MGVAAAGLPPGELFQKAWHPRQGQLHHNAGDSVPWNPLEEAGSQEGAGFSLAFTPGTPGRDKLAQNIFLGERPSVSPTWAQDFHVGLTPDARRPKEYLQYACRN